MFVWCDHDKEKNKRILRATARHVNTVEQSKEVQQKLHDSFFFVDNKLLNSKDLTAKILSDEKRYAPIVDKVLEQQKK